MSVLKKTYQILSLAAGFVLLSVVLSACNLVVDGEYPDVSSDHATKYINLTLYVSSDGTAITRSPLGGENGDGREAGYTRENQVSGVTVILYKGSGMTDPNARVDFVRYFTVTEDNLEGRDVQGTTYNYDAAETYRSEARYTTGDQKVAEEELDFNGIYHVLIVANQDVSGVCAKGTLISSIRDLTINNVYSVADADKAKPDQYQQFVMTSERDATIDFGSMAPVQKPGVENGLVYRVLQPMLIERMSARIDYYTNGATYDDAKGGYVYPVENSSDIFVVTKVTPFNLYNEEEYLFKRVRTDWTSDGVISWLGDETTSNYVVDPNTANKDNSQLLSDSYLSPIAAAMSGDYGQAMNKTFSNGQLYQIANKDNIIIAYPKENTLLPSSHLKKYATGIAFEVKYYVNGTGTPSTKVYYHYLRHQGESYGTYKAKLWSELDNLESISSHDPVIPMCFGIVRNNIYRVSIESMNQVEGTLKIKIEEEKWRHVDNPAIYI